jgi:hypothetical protein
VLVLPIVSEPVREQIVELLGTSPAEWKRELLHRLKQNNPEVNALLLELAQGSQDPKATILAGFAVYHALELALKEEDSEMGL